MHTILSIKQSEQSDPPIFGFNVTVKNISEITMRLSRQKHKASNIMQPCMVALCPLYKVNQRLYAEASFLQAQMKACGLPPPSPPFTPPPSPPGLHALPGAWMGVLVARKRTGGHEEFPKWIWVSLKKTCFSEVWMWQNHETMKKVRVEMHNYTMQEIKMEFRFHIIIRITWTYSIEMPIAKLFIPTYRFFFIYHHEQKKITISSKSWSTSCIFQNINNFHFMYEVWNRRLLGQVSSQNEFSFFLYGLKKLVFTQDLLPSDSAVRMRTNRNTTNAIILIVNNFRDFVYYPWYITGSHFWKFKSRQ